jgi:hypothetical protein
MQRNVTSKTLQAIVYLGGSNLWVAGRGGAILKRNEALATFKTSGAKIVPRLLQGGPKRRERVPAVVITDDGDIPQAIPPKKL